MALSSIKEYSKISLTKLFKHLNSSHKGLTDREAKKRLKIHGYNEIAKGKKIPVLFKFLSYFKDPLIIILIIAALISGLTGQIKNVIILISMVLLSVLMNFYQEYRASSAAEQIAKKLSIRALVLRNNNKIEILTKDLVAGDVVLLSAGDIVPADGRIISCDDFFINESTLTGESFPVEKNESDNNMVLSGTTVVAGYSQIIIIATGLNTEYGKIADKLQKPSEINAFQIGIKNFSYLIIKAIIGIVLAVFLINVFRQKNMIDSFIFSLAIAVGITPELLPMIISINMAKGSISMAKKGVIVKRLNAIPDFGSIDILCTDKTGTLTEDRITLVKHLDVFGNENEEVLRLIYINGYFETGIKSVLDQAILEHSSIKNIKKYKKIDEIPYDFMRKRSSIVYEEKNQRKMVTKGAPEEIFKICSHYFETDKKTKITSIALKKFETLYDDLSQDGFRVLALACKDVAGFKKAYPKTEETDMVLMGFVAFYDPPKQGVRETFDLVEEYGIEIKILTGDNPLVAKKICQDVDIPIKDIVTGEELDLDKMNDEAIMAKIKNASILARLSPIQKEKIIEVLRQSGKIVGYLGDGINDAPALKAADVGISVNNAVDIAIETADIILLKKGLKEIMDGIIEGRKTFGNTMKYMMMGLSSNFGNMLSMIGAALYLPFFPMMPSQILLNNFLYDTSQLSIPLDNIDKEYLKKPKHWDIKFIRNFMLTFGPISSLFDFITFYILFAVFNLHDSAFQTGWFIESLATQVFVIYIIRTKLIPFFQSSPSKFLFFSTLAAVFFGIILTYSFIGHIFGFKPLPFAIILIIFSLVAIYLVLIEFVKHIFYKRYAMKNQLF